MLHPIGSCSKLELTMVTCNPTKKKATPAFFFSRYTLKPGPLVWTSQETLCAVNASFPSQNNSSTLDTT